MGDTIPGGSYLGGDGRLHDAHGKHLDAGDADADAKAEQRKAAGVTETDATPKPKAKKAKKAK